MEEEMETLSYYFGFKAWGYYPNNDGGRNENQAEHDLEAANYGII